MLTGAPAPAPLPTGTQPRRVRVCYFNTWATRLQTIDTYVAGVPELDLVARLADRNDGELLKKARLDCDWHAENARCFGALRHARIEFLPAWTTGMAGLFDLAKAPRETNEERWLLTMAHQPQAFGAQAGKTFELLGRMGVRHLYYAYDEASRAMPCFAEIAPYLDVLIHDESPLEPAGQTRLKASCRSLHRSWVANVLPFATPFNETPEVKILFLGSQLGLTPHRRRQIDFLGEKFPDRFVACHDHSVAIGQRTSLSRYKVALCPEGRMFTTRAMAKTHTDRPFWSGCLGLVPVSEDSAAGGRLEELHAAGLILRYAHGDLNALAEKCEQALARTNASRRKIYEHFNRHETIGHVVAEALSGT